MEVEDEILPQELTEKEKTICRTYMNSKLDIFQNNTEFLFRTPAVVPFKQSYERNIMMNEATSILSSHSDLLFYTVGGKFNNIHHSKRHLKNLFTQPSNASKSPTTLSSDQINEEFKDIEMKIMRNKLKSDSDYLAICSYINLQNFSQLFLTNKNFATMIMNYSYIQYHPKFKELQQLYLASFPS